MSTPAVRPLLRRLALRLAATVTVVICLFPVYWMISTAFKPSKDIQSADPRLVPHTWTLDHFRRAVEADGFALFWRNSILVTLGPSCWRWWWRWARRTPWRGCGGGAGGSSC